MFAAPSPPPPSSESEVPTAGEAAIDAGNNEESAGVIAGTIIGCLILVAALGAGGFYYYNKKKPPSRPADVEIIVSSPSSNKDAARRDSTGVTIAPTERAEAAPAAALPSAVPVSGPCAEVPSEDLTLTAVLASCGLEHRAKLFEDEGYTLEVAFRALDSGQSTLLTDLRDRNLLLGECRRLITQLKAAKNSASRTL